MPSALRPVKTLSRVGPMEGLLNVKAANDYYDDVHYQRRGNNSSTLCGLKVTGGSTEREVSCLRCRQFADGNF